MLLTCTNIFISFYCTREVKTVRPTDELQVQILKVLPLLPFDV